MPRGGHNRKTPEEKAALGTLQVTRLRDQATYIEPAATPNMPDWLTDAGKSAWLDVIEKIVKASAGNDLDDEYIGHFCNMHGACIEAWKSGICPPVNVLREVTQMMKNLRVAGTMSRAVVVKEHMSAASNPFARAKPNFQPQGGIFAGQGRKIK